MQRARGGIQGEPEMMARRPAPRPAVMPNIPNFSNIPNMPNLQGIGGIPGLSGLDFSNLPQGLNFSGLPQPIDLTQRPQTPTGNFTTMRENMPPAVLLQAPVDEFGRQGKPSSFSGLEISDEATRLAEQYNPQAMSGTPAQRQSALEMIQATLNAGEGEQGVQNLYANNMQTFQPQMPTGPALDLPNTLGGLNPVPMPSVQQPQMSNLPMPLANPDNTFTKTPLTPQAPVMPTAPGQPTTLGGLNPVPMPSQPAQPTAPAPVAQPLAPYTGSNEPAPYASNVVRTETGMDALTKQLLFGLDGQGGFIPGAMRAAEKTFFNADGTPRVVEEQVAGQSPDQIRAQELARAGIGIQDPFLQQAGDAYATGIGALDQGLMAARSRAEQGLGATQRGVSQEEALRNQGLNRVLGGIDQFGQRSGSLGRQAMDSTAAFGGRLGESEGLIRGTTGAYDPSLTSQFYNPYEDQVVQQTIDDVFKAGEQQDMAARARNIQTGGESAFGSRARLGAAERREALGRGLGQSLGSLRAQGFGQAQQTGLNEFARQRAAERSAASGLSGLAGSRLASQQSLGSNLQGLSGQQLAAQQAAGSALGGSGQSALAGQQQLASAFSGLGNLEGQIGQQRQQAQFGLGSNLQGLGQQAQTANQAGVGQLFNIGQQQQSLQQQQLDAQRRNQLQAQQAPLAQYQALSPFISMAPQGQFQARTTFAPPPSPMQAALTTGLGAFGTIGNFMNPGTRR